MILPVQHHFRHDISMKSSCAHHCVTWALSDMGDEAFAMNCDEPHTEECSFCDSIPLLIAKLLGAVQEQKTGDANKDAQLIEVVFICKL